VKLNEKVTDVRFEVFTAMKIQVMVFWVVMLCTVTVGYQHFRGPCCLHLQGEVHGDEERERESVCVCVCVCRPGMQEGNRVHWPMGSGKWEGAVQQPVVLAVGGGVHCCFQPGTTGIKVLVESPVLADRE
jgi:hypothetical protein